MSFMFYIMALILIASAVAVITVRNPIHSALFLVLNLMTVAGVYALLQAHFLAAAQIIVYAGAIMVLVIFVVMLLNVKEERTGTTHFFLLSVSTVMGALFVCLFIVFLQTSDTFSVAVGTKVTGTVENIGKILFSQYFFPFEAASILIMAAIVGAVMITKKHIKGK